MTVFDYLIEQLLEILRLSIYRYAGRTAPARRARKDAAVEARVEKKIEKRSRRRRSAPWGNLLIWVLILPLGVFVVRRLTRRR